MIRHLRTFNKNIRDLSDCIFPIDSMPNIPETEKIIADYEEKNPIILKIRYIPHLKLKIPPFDLNRALSEISHYYKNNDFMQLDLKGIPYKEGGQYFWYDGLHDSWNSRALINYIPESKGTWGKEDRELAVKNYPEYQPIASNLKSRRPFLQDMKFYKTEIWDSLPYITNYIMENFCEDFLNMRRTHLYKLNSGGLLNFHNHRLLPWESYAAPHDEGIIHIPLITHPESLMLEQLGDSHWIDAQHYLPGEAYLLNTYMNHAVDNTQSPIDRLHLTIMIDFSDKKFVEIIERSL
jgi:hypothetical protein